MNKISLLVVDDDSALRELLLRRFSDKEFDVTTSDSGTAALELIKTKNFDVGVLDILMPGITGTRLLKEIKDIQPEFEAIMLTGQTSVDTAIEAMKLGAYDYLTKPCKLLELEMIIRKAYEKKKMADQLAKLSAELRHKSVERPLAGTSKAIRMLLDQTGRLAPMSEPVIIVGDMGVGKEVAALTIHNKSPRKESPFVPINCGVLPDATLEAKLFGNEADAFIGAESRNLGLLEFADGGSVYLDEVEQLSSSMQVKLLQYLDTGSFRRIGGHLDIASNARLFFATTENLLSATKRGNFREDLYYRISTFTINVPPLRDRKEDILDLAEHIIANSSIAVGHKKVLSKKAQQALMEYNWPGNVRELASVLERAISLTDKNIIQMKNLPLSFEKKSVTNKNRHLMSLHEIEREHILFVLDAVNGNISRAAKILGVSRPKLYRKIEKYKSGSGV